MSVNSSTELCKLAADLLSASTSITDVENPTTPEEELYARWYDITRKKLLREHPWNFAATRIVLAASSTAPAFGYDKSFPLPSDFVRLLQINDKRFTYDVPSTSEFYQLEGNSILTSDLFTAENTLNLTYVKDFTDVPRMDPMFVNLLAHEVALAVAFKVTESNTNVQRLAKIKQEASRLAKAVDGQERPPRRIERSKSRHVRTSAGRGNEHRIIFDGY